MPDALSALLAAIGHQRAGRLQEAEGLLRSVLATDSDEPSALFLLGSTVLALGRAAEAAALLARAVSLRPDHREQRQALARALLTQGRAAEALDALAPLAAIVTLAEVQFLLGTALNTLRRPRDAVNALAHAVAADPNHAEAHLNLGNAYADLNEIAQAETHMRRAIALNPDLAEAHASLGFLLTGRGQIGPAVQACQRAIDLQPDFALAHWNQGIAHLLGGQMEEGWAKYEWRKRRFPAAFSAPPGPEWDGTPLDGRTLLVLAEQGFGDTIQLCRYLPPLVQGGAQVLLECAQGLMPLLRCLPGLTLLPPHHLAGGTARPPYDVWVDQMSLPRLFATTLETIPSPAGYLRPTPARTAAWEARLPPGLRVGLVWAGNPAHSNDRRRSIPTGALAPLIAIRADALVSLQVGRTARDITRMFGITNHAAYLTDFGETAAAIARMDLVITVDTAVAHLSAALGIPTWIMLPHAPDWRWLLDRDDSPWYSSVRLFRQNRPGDWTGVIKRVAAALETVTGPAYSIAMPPLTCSVAPVTQPASAEAR
jgi:tetratricopeptide (TPR) repeat protein